MARTSIPILALLVLALFNAGCGSDDDHDGPTPQVNLTGTWDATITVTGGTKHPAGYEGHWTIALQQEGTDVTGAVTEAAADAGVLTGSINGTTFSFTIALRGKCSPGSYTGSGTVNTAWTEVTGNGSGTDTCGTMQGTFELTKK